MDAGWGGVYDAGAGGGGEGATDIVEYETATGKRRVLVSHEQLRPSAGAKPLVIEDYVWSKDEARLLIYTESKRVWRTNSREIIGCWTGRRRS